MSLAHSSNLRSFAGFVQHHGPAVFFHLTKRRLFPIYTKLYNAITSLICVREPRKTVKRGKLSDGMLFMLASSR
jgi:hypothetical protein